jgi:3-deoxy-D-manno-octulosonate 8-phosphate phosphatase (KDO 8-P phosphatase)
MESITEKLKKVRMLALDFDGVFTDNRVFFSEDGKESVICSRADSLGIRMLKEKRKDIYIIVISKEKNRIVSARCEKLGIDSLSGVDNKLEALKKVASSKGINLDLVAYVGNDVNDLECLNSAGIAVAVADAVPQVLEAADIITKGKGGLGAIREFSDMLIDSKKRA